MTLSIKPIRIYTGTSIIFFFSFNFLPHEGVPMVHNIKFTRARDENFLFHTFTSLRPYRNIMIYEISFNFFTNLHKYPESEFIVTLVELWLPFFSKLINCVTATLNSRNIKRISHSLEMYLKSSL